MLAWSLFLTLLPAARAERCALPETLDALRGEAAPLHAGMLAAPERLGRLPSPTPPPAGEKAVYGTNYEDHLETKNFTINWWDDDIDLSYATPAGEALERAWTTFVEESGWTPPVSSDRYYIWVLLDRSLGSTTGYTTEYYTDLYPEGYPVIYLNPSSLELYGEDFWASLAEHEFMHALQYAVREWDGVYEGESWYWEASATYACQLVEPELDAHEYTSAWYAGQPELRYDSREGGHDYGIFVLNAWLEESLTGEGGLLAAWTLGAAQPDWSWDQILAESAGVGVDEIWGGFSGAYGNRQLAESALYTRVSTQGGLEEGASGTLPYLGTHYWRAGADTLVSAEGEVVLAGAEGVGAELLLADGDMLAVTGLADDVTYTLHLADPSEAETGGETGAPAETGGGEESGEGEPGEGEDTGGSGEKAAGCACASPGSVAHGTAIPPLLALALLAARRRRA